MTVISTVITNKAIVFGSDSLTTVRTSAGLERREQQKPKIIHVEKLNAAIAYFGLAAVEGGGSDFSTRSWLTFRRPVAGETLDEYARRLTAELEAVLRSLPIAAKERGIGLHLAGFEVVKGYRVPELFFICNFDSPDYTKVVSLAVARQTFGTVASEAGNMDTHGEAAQRLKVRTALQAGHMVFNNGDPLMYNTAASGLQSSLEVCKKRGLIRSHLDLDAYKTLALEPIRHIGVVQKRFFVPTEVRVGGALHGLVLHSDARKPEAFYWP